MSNLTVYNLCGPSNCVSVFCVLFRPGGGWAKGSGPQLPPVLPLPLRLDAAEGAAVLSAHRPHSAGAGRHRCVGREHEDPVLPGHLRTPNPSAEWKHLWRVRWVWQLEVWLQPSDKLCYQLIWNASSRHSGSLWHLERCTLPHETSNPSCPELWI